MDSSRNYSVVLWVEKVDTLKPGIHGQTGIRRAGERTSRQADGRRDDQRKGGHEDRPSGWSVGRWDGLLAGGRSNGGRTVVGRLCAG